MAYFRKHEPLETRLTRFPAVSAELVATLAGLGVKLPAGSNYKGVTVWAGESLDERCRELTIYSTGVVIIMESEGDCEPFVPATIGAFNFCDEADLLGKLQEMGW